MSKKNIITQAAQIAVQTELEYKRLHKLPIARFALETKEVFLEKPDGTKTLIGKAMKRGRYSQWANNPKGEKHDR